MDKITQKDMSPQSEEELTSPLSPKRPRTDWANNHCEESRFDFSETFQKNTGSPSSISTLQMNADLICPAELGDNEDEKPCEQEDTKLIVTPITNLTTSHSDGAHTRSSKASFITAERCLLLLVKDEQPLVTECDKLSSYLLDDAGGALAESHTSQDASADTSSHPDCKRLGESLEDKPPGGCNLPAGNGQEGRQVQNVSQIQAFTRNSSDEEVRCQSGSTHEEILNDTGLCNTWSQSAEAEESNQKRDEQGFSEIILLGKEKEEGNTPISYSDYADTQSFYPNAEPSGNLAEGVKNEEEKLELQICENEDVAVCETKGQFNNNGLSKNTNHCAAECAEGSIVSYNVVSARNIAIENVSLKADVFCGAKGEHAAGKMIAKARSETADHTAETPMPARISQELAEGDNDVGPFSVIDPAIWSETDREAGETRCNSESTTGAELSPSVKVCEMEMPLPPCSDVRPSEEVSFPDQTWQFNHRSRTQQCKDEKEDLCQSYTAPQACSITTNGTHNKTANEGSCLWKSSPSSRPKLPPAEDGRQEGLETVGHRLKEQDQSGCFPVSLKHLKTQEVEHLQIEIARMEGGTELKEREEVSSDEHGKSQYSVDLDERLLQQNEKHEDGTKITTGGCINGWTAGELSKYGNNLTRIDEGNNLECLSDHAYSAVIPVDGMEGITAENETKDEASVGKETEANSEILVISEDGHQQQSPKKREMTEASPDDCISEWTEGNMSNSANKSTLVSQHEQGNKLSYFSDYQHKAETFMVENKDDLLASTFPATSDAVVPGPHELTPSQNASNNPSALNCSDRFSPVPSAFTFYDRALGGFDTFERIQLSLDDDDDDDGSLSNSPLLTSLAGQLLKTPQRQLYHSTPEAKSANKHEVVPEEEEEEVERLECHTENMASGFLSSDYSCNEVPNFISAGDITALRWPQQQPNSESACSSSESVQDDLNPQSSESNSPASDLNDSPKFEMKKQFDVVLKELNLYFDISMSDFASDGKEGEESSPEQCSDVTEAVEDKTSSCKDQLSSPDLRHHGDTSSGK